MRWESLTENSIMLDGLASIPRTDSKSGWTKMEMKRKYMMKIMLHIQEINSTLRGRVVSVHVSIGRASV